MPREDALLLKGKDTIRNSVIGPGVRFFLFDHAEYPEEGGMYLWYKGQPFPQKGFPFPEAIQGNDMLKRITLTMLKVVSGRELIPSLALFAVLPWRFKMKTINRAIENWVRVADWNLMGAYLEEKRYSNPARAIRKAAKNFLLVLGVPPFFAEEASKAICTVIEYDNAYRFRIQDLASETRQMRLGIRPWSEVRRIGKLYASREKTHAAGNVAPIFRLLSVALLHPKIRKAWKVAITHLSPDEFKWLQLDNADRYHVLIRGDYNFTGRTFEERAEIYKDVHRGSLCCQAKVKRIPPEMVVREEGKHPKEFACLKCGRPAEEAYAFPPEQAVVE